MFAFHERSTHLNKEKHVKKEQNTNTSDGEANPDPELITRESDSDEVKDETEEAAESETCRLLEKYKENRLYPDGAPEKFAEKRIEELFENWSKEKDWHYLKAYKKFTEMYPRVTSGKPWVPWVSDSLIKKGNVLKQAVSPPDHD